MESKNDKEIYIVQEFLFDNQQEAQLALEEERKIQYLENKMDYSDPSSVYSIYQKMIENSVFKTIVGYKYLLQLKSFLSKECSDEEISKLQYIKVVTNRKDNFLANVNQEENRKKVQAQKKQLQKENYKLKVVIGVLFGLIVAMFAITFTSKNPNMLNYRQAITNEYSTWEQELTEREKVIREKERQLGD